MLVLAALTALVLAQAQPAAAAQPYPVLVERDGLRVYAPRPGGRWGRCPKGPATVRAHDLPVAERAVLLAVPRLYAGAHIDIRGAKARALRIGANVSTRPGLARAACGRRTAARSLAVHVSFPRVTRSASLSSATFFVARVPDGWVLWHQAH